ncbi:hypothetical protein D918_05413 [Trichuris suis]|nr:hypothetical protein D918_05413 [Trichuris suis]
MADCPQRKFQTIDKHVIHYATEGDNFRNVGKEEEYCGCDGLSESSPKCIVIIAPVPTGFYFHVFNKPAE